MFEAKIVEFVNPAEDYGSRAPKPKNLLRVGFSTSGSPLIMGEAENSVCFESEGAFMNAKKRTQVTSRFVRDDVLAVLLNLEEKSPNFNTVSLFKNGVRVSQPQALPEAMQGQTLYPTVSFKNMTLHVNLGNQPLAALPFTCRMVQDASQKDAAVTAPVVAKDGKYEVLMPVGLPDEGSLEWLDMFMEKNPGYLELSDRMILDWAEKSGIWRQGGYKARTSNDKPELNFGVRELDDGSIRRSIMALAPLQARNYIIAEVRGNLIKEDRKEVLARFDSANFKKYAQVVVGDPTSDFRKRTNQHLLKQKQETVNAEFAVKKAEEKRKKLLEKRQKELEKARKRAEKVKKRQEIERKKKIEEAKKAAEAAKAEEKKEEKDKEEGKDEAKKDEEMKDEEKKDDKEEAKEDEAMEEDDEEEEEEKEEAEDPEEEPPVAELTAEEKKVPFFKGPVPDLTPFSLSTALGKLSLPEKSEGFDDVRYEWSKAQKAQEHLKEWVSDKKLNTRIEDITPSDWFSGKLAQWQRVLQSWHSKHAEYKAALAKKEAAKAAKLNAAKAAELAKKVAEAKKQQAAAKEGDEAKEKESEATPMDEDKKEEEKEEEEEFDFEGLDCFGLEDVNDIGNGEPLFKEFQFEDWTMMTLRFELHLLAHAFRHDVEDAERAGIHLDHLPFYYQRYFKKALTSKSFGVETVAELVDLANDAVFVTKKQVLESQLEAEMESLQIFVKLVEEARRFRQVRIALGEKGAKLNLSQPHHFPQSSKGSGGGGGKRGGKGHWQGDKG
eukprot:CAMPEP_0197879366 /NCGR_PEP_ID=MMETSP1439-20131203/7480_1 /TAXON_ID=66791 /ORGANISM="Gonyaulax spinifera, Strain CCMP409" /LENGTH=776 /DNA_ID=CAMNT_0043498863 /DNA_START=1 /DNA_END=2327 /DNA_ORIENTATION=-